MKTKIVFIAFLALSFSSYAKSQAGIYMNLSDFKNNKLTCENKGKGKTIRTHDFFWNMPGIRVLCDGKKITYRKSDLYGYRDHDNNVYRFYNNSEYRIQEAGHIYIYVQEKNMAQSKGYKVVNAYYFSTTADGGIVPLTLGNLKAAYRTNDKFRDLLDQFFSNESVTTYDNKHNTFKVNYVYSKSINANN